MSGRILGLITAAGLSSRMGAFKPLLDLDGKPLIARTVESMLQGGASQIVLVTGRNGDELEEALLGYPEVIRVHNAAFRETAMFDSIKIGLKQMMELGSCDAFLVMPADIPAIRPETIQGLLEEWQKETPDVLYPVCQGEQGHPPVVKGAKIPELLRDCGELGLRGAFARVCPNALEVTVSDPATLMDADYKEDYEALCAYWPNRYYPKLSQCEIFYEMAGTPKKVQEHSKAVRKKALEIGRELKKKGISLNLDLIESAALLHDVKRTEPHHAVAGAEFLQKQGLKEVAEPVLIHMDWPSDRTIAPDEAAVLYLADKLVSGDQNVSLEERFLQKERRFAEDAEILANIQKRKNAALKIKACFEEYGLKF